MGAAYTTDEIVNSTGYWGAIAHQDADSDFPELTGRARYAAEAAKLNTARAKAILLMRCPGFADWWTSMYKFLRSLNPVQYIPEQTIAIAEGREPVLGTPISRGKAAMELLLYVALLKGTSYLAGKITGAYVGAGTGDAAAYSGVEFAGGGRLSVVSGYEPNAYEAEAAVALAEDGETVILKSPPPGSVRSPEGDTADLLVLRDGKPVPFDIKTPGIKGAASPNGIFKLLRRGNSQAQGVVLDLRYTDVRLEDLGNIMGRLQGVGATNINEVIVIKQDGTIVNLYRR